MPVFTVRDDVAVEVWHDHDIKLVWVRNELHSTVVDNDVIICDVGVFEGDFSADLSEKSVSLFHNVRYVKAQIVFRDKYFYPCGRR